MLASVETVPPTPNRRIEIYLDDGGVEIRGECRFFAWGRVHELRGWSPVPMEDR